MAGKRRQAREEKITGKEVVLRALASVEPNPWNPNVMTPDQFESLKFGLENDGWLLSQALLVWGVDEETGEEKNVIIDGEHRYRAALELGFKQGPMVFITCTEAHAKKLTIACNAKRGTFDQDELRDLVRSIESEVGESIAMATGIASDDLAKMLDYEIPQTTPPPPPSRAGSDEEDDEAEPPPPPPVAVTKPGDLWILGNHRVYCGDALIADERAKLLEGALVDCVVTDPPYAIYGSSSGISTDIADDKMVRPFFEAVFRAIGDSLREFGHAYVCCDWRSWASVWEGAKRAQIAPKNCIVWDKLSSGLGSSYAMTYEMVGFFARLPILTAMTSHAKRGQRVVHKPNLVRYPRVSGKERQHNAAKPVALFRDLIENSTDPGETVLDLFLGSGTTVIACEQTGRKALGFEIEPRHCDVIVRRWEELTGETAIRVPADEAPSPSPSGATLGIEANA